MSKHTPGPWTVLTFPSETFAEIRAHEGYMIVGHVFFNNGERDATARLIAAAPVYAAMIDAMTADTERSP